MAPLDATGPNAEQIKYWNEQAGPRWIAAQDLVDPQIAPLGVHAMERLALRSGERVLDVGCGCGATTIALAQRVGATGTAMGVDLSAAMLDEARARASREGVRHVRFENADAQTYRFEPSQFDALFSRFGVMFFADPVTAFANLRSALRPGGRVGFVCWRPLQENEWMLVPVMAVAQHVPLPAPPPPGAPGPFAFADADRVRTILTDAGYRDVVIDPLNDMLGVGGADVERTVEFFFQVGPTATILRDATPDQRTAAATALRDVLAAHLTPDGVRMRGAAWLVTARNK